MLTKELDNIINKLPNGLIDGYEFFASSSFKNKIKSYKGVKVNYMNIIKPGVVYYIRKDIITYNGK